MPSAKFRCLLAVLGASAMTVPSTRADVRLPAFFSDGMVLQRDQPLPVWGAAEKGENVTVRLAGQTRTATAGEDGRWTVRFDPLPATAPGEAALTLEVEGHNRVAVADVLVGEVWLCSGQSNMEFTVDMGLDAAREIAAADFPRVRQFRVPRVGAPTPRDAWFVQGASWEPANPQTVGKFTAVGYYFAREVSRTLGGMPVGLINSAWGGTAIQSWMSVESLRAEPGRYEALLRGKEHEIADWPARLRGIEEATAEWERRAAAAHGAGQPEPPNKPWNPGAPDLPQWTPTQLYNGMIHPLQPYAIRGVLWYQGEANAGWGRKSAQAYTKLLSEMIRDWRAAWSEGDFPFYFVQLPNWNTNTPPGDSWAWFRDGQRAVLDVPNTGMAVAIDVGESDNIHPHDKQTVGGRLARIALHRLYGRPVADQGPTYRALTPTGEGAVRVEFDHAEGGLVVKGDGAPRHFEVAGEDRKFHPSEAIVEGSAVVVSSAEVARPVAVRYAWSDDPAGCNLYNRNGLPATPFRTDDW